MAKKKGPKRPPTAQPRTRKSLPPVSEEDRAVWQAVKNSVSPKKLSTTKTFRGIISAAEALPPTPKPDPEQTKQRRLTSSTKFTIVPNQLLQGRRPTVNYNTKKKDLKPGQLDGLDRKRGDRLRKGKLEIEGTLDLHGMTRDSAQAAVNRFVSASQNMGRRTVLIITGKGYHHGDGGILRSELPRWLNSGTLRSKVVAYDFAQPRHGGQGAFYVYIKKIRD